MEELVKQAPAKEEKVIARSLSIDSKGNEEEVVVTEEAVAEATAAANAEQPLITKNSIVEYLNNENVQKNLRLWANEFKVRFHDNWFSIAQVVKKTQMKSADQGMQILEFLILSGLAHRELRNGIMKYKITLSMVEKVKLLRIQQDAYRQEIETIENEIKQLFAKESQKDLMEVADVTNK